MLAKVICKECDLIIDKDSFGFNDTIAYQAMRHSLLSHYDNTGHTLVKLELTLEERDMKGEFRYE